MTQGSLLFPAQTVTIQLSACMLADVPNDAVFYVRLHGAANGVLKAYRKGAYISKNFRGLWPPDREVFVEVVS